MIEYMITNVKNQFVRMPIDKPVSVSEKVNKLWSRATGDPELFSLEHRIFNSIILLMVLILFGYAPVNLLLGHGAVALLSAFACLVCGFIYYLSRFKRKLKAGIVGIILIGNIYLIPTYFLNSGTSGPVDVYLIDLMIIMVAILPYRQFKIFFFLNSFVFLSLHAVEYYYPQWVHYTNDTHAVYFFDKTAAVIISIIVVYFIVKSIRSNYNYENQKAEEKTRAIQDQEQYIILQNANLENLNAEKNKFLSVISHDLTAPLNNIQNYLELVTAKGLEKKERALLEASLLKVTDETLNMLTKLLAWSKAQMDGAVVKLTDLNVLLTLKSMLELEQALAHSKAINLTYRIDAGIIIRADQDMLELVVRNLVNNAIKFTADHGNIHVSTHVVGHECKICIEDNGEGIASEKQSEIFSLRAAATYGTRNEKGVGLGLLLCKEFTELQGGRIGFESKPGLGSTFFIYMPMA